MTVTTSLLYPDDSLPYKDSHQDKGGSGKSHPNIGHLAKIRISLF